MRASLDRHAGGGPWSAPACWHADKQTYVDAWLGSHAPAQGVATRSEFMCWDEDGGKCMAFAGGVEVPDQRSLVP